MVEETQNQIQETDEGAPIKKRRSTFIAMGACLLVAGAIGFFYTLPHYRSASALITERDTKTQEKTMKEQELAKIKADNAKPHEFTAEEKAVLAQLPNEINVPALIRTLDSISYLSSSVSLDDTYLRSFTIGEPSGGDKIKLVPITGSFSSSQYSLFDLLRKFESSANRIFNINSIQISFASRETTEGSALFSNPGKDTQYQFLIAKRQTFLMTEKEREELANLQEELGASYNVLLAKRNRTESEENRLQALKSELDTLQAESQYTLSITTYVESSSQ